MPNDSVHTAAVPLTDRHPLDNPARSALLGPHARLAERRGQVLRYPSDVCPFVALPDEPDAGTWREVAELLGPGALVALAVTQAVPPQGWEVELNLTGVQLVDQGMTTTIDSEAIPLGPDDVPEMLALVERTKPGPFLPRTIEMGSYLGIRREGALVAMAGERLHPPGWTEISAVCTDPHYQGQGLASRLVRTVAVGIRARGETPFLHASAANTTAIRLYEALGFRLRKRVGFLAARVPEGEPVW